MNVGLELVRANPFMRQKNRFKAIMQQNCLQLGLKLTALSRPVDWGRSTSRFPVDLGGAPPLRSPHPIAVDRAPVDTGNGQNPLDRISWDKMPPDGIPLLKVIPSTKSPTTIARRRPNTLMRIYFAIKVVLLDYNCDCLYILPACCPPEQIAH